VVVSQLDEVAWLFNLRGSDIPYNPVRMRFFLTHPCYPTPQLGESVLRDKF
jgi:hypothetical protein